MKRPEYLESAIRDGLMFTDHLVEFSPTNDRNLLSRLVSEIKPIIERRLMALGRSLATLTLIEERCVFAGIGSIKGQIPMLCFTEVPNGRILDTHRTSFGEYGLVISQRWVEDNGGDKVIYVGNGSAISCQLFKLLAKVRLADLFVGPSGNLLFDNSGTRDSLDFFSHIEVRANIEQSEWRIPGLHGFMGGPKSTNQRLPLRLDAIETILVPASDIGSFSSLVNQLAEDQGQIAPRVEGFGDTLTP